MERDKNITKVIVLSGIICSQVSFSCASTENAPQQLFVKLNDNNVLPTRSSDEAERGLKQLLVDSHDVGNRGWVKLRNVVKLHNAVRAVRSRIISSALENAKPQVGNVKFKPEFRHEDGKRKGLLSLEQCHEEIPSFVMDGRQQQQQTLEALCQHGNDKTISSEEPIIIPRFEPINLGPVKSYHHDKSFSERSKSAPTTSLSKCPFRTSPKSMNSSRTDFIPSLNFRKEGFDSIDQELHKVGESFVPVSAGPINDVLQINDMVDSPTLPKSQTCEFQDYYDDYDSLDASSKSEDDFLLNVPNVNHESPGLDENIVFINSMKKEFVEHIKNPILRPIANVFLNFLHNNKEFIEIIKILYAQQLELTTASEDLLDFSAKQKSEKRWNIAQGTISILDNASKVILPFSFNSLLAIPGFILTGTEFGISFFKRRNNVAIRKKIKDCQSKMGQRADSKANDDKKNCMFNVLQQEILNEAIDDLGKIHEELKTYIEVNNHDNFTADVDSLRQELDTLKSYTNTYPFILSILNGAKAVAGISASIMEMIPFTHDYDIAGLSSLKLTPGNLAVLLSSSLTLLHNHVEKADKDARYAESAVKICETYTSLLTLFENIITSQTETPKSP